MNSDYAIEIKDDYVCMTVSGKYNFQDFKSYTSIVHEKCEQEKIFKVLFDATNVAGINVPALEKYFLGVEVAQVLQYKIKLAVVWHKDFINRFFENVAVNRGGNVCVSDSTQKSLDWLFTESKK